LLTKPSQRFGVSDRRRLFWDTPNRWLGFVNN